MSDQAVDIAEPTTEAPANGASAVQEAPAAPDTQGASADEPWREQFPNGAQDLWKSYNELRTRFSRGEHLAEPEAEPQPDEAADPFASLPPEDDERTVRQLVAYFQQAGGKAVVEWIDGNPGYVSNQTANEFFKAWQQNDPRAAQQYEFERFYSQREGAFQQQFADQLAPVASHVQAQINSAAISQAATIIPEWETWAPKIIAYLEQYPGVINDVRTDPESLAHRLGEVYGMLAWRESLEGQQQQTQAPAEGGRTPPRTATRSTPQPDEQAERTTRELENLKRMRGK